MKHTDIAALAHNSRKGELQHAEGAFFSLEDTKAMLGYRRKQQETIAVDSHKLAYSAFVHSRPRYMGGTEDSSLLTKFYESCVTPDERGNFAKWVESFSPWKLHKDDEAGIYKFKFNKKGNAWNFEAAYQTPFMMRDTRKATIQELKNLAYVTDKLEDFLSRQKKFLSSDKYDGGVMTSELSQALARMINEVREIRERESIPQITGETSKTDDNIKTAA